MTKIYKLRKSVGLSQERIARQLGVSRNTVKNWEDGKTNIPFIMAVKMADLLGVSLDDLKEEKK